LHGGLNLRYLGGLQVNELSRNRKVNLTMVIKEDKQTLNNPYLDIIEKIMDKIEAEDFKQRAKQVEEMPFPEEKESGVFDLEDFSLADRYKLIYITMLDKLPMWKRKVVKKSMDDRITNELAREVATLAESEDWVDGLDNLE